MGGIMRPAALLLALISAAVVRSQEGSTFLPTNFTLVANSGITLTANITELTTSPEWVQVSWSGVKNPSLYDAVAFVTPANAVYNVTAPQKFFWASTSPGYLSSGAGSANFHVLNHRADFKFIFVTGVSDWLGNFTQLAQTAPIPLAASQRNAPTQIHMMFAGNTSTDITVQWTTTDKGTGSTVQYGTTPGVYSFESNATNITTYTQADMCGGLASHAGYIFPGYFNNAPMFDLESSTRYYYRVGSDEPGFGWSPEYSFLTAAPVGPTSSVDFLALADLGFCEVDGSIEWPGWYANDAATTPPGTGAAYTSMELDNALNQNWIEPCGALATARAMARDIENRTLIIHNGDLSYALGWVYGWDAYLDMLAPILTQAPYMIVLGNHEQDWAPSGVGRFPTSKDSGGECGQVTTRRFPMPAAGNWYSYAYGPIHMNNWDTELEYGAGSPQYTWMLSDLASVNRSVTPWLVSNFHRPFYTSSVYGNSLTGDIGNQNDERDAFEIPLFTYQADMTLYGHVHEYSRTCPIFQENCIPKDANGSNLAPVHVLIGHAGQTFSLDNSPVTPDFFEVEAIQHGYMRASATQTQMTVEVVNSLSGKLTDAFNLTKPVGWKANFTAQSSFISNFYGNYTPTEWQLHGINGGQEGVQDAAEDAILKNPAMLEALSNITYVLNPDSPDELAFANQIYAPLYQAYEDTIAGTPQETPEMKLIWTLYFKPLWTSYLQHPDGLLKGPELGPAFADEPTPFFNDPDPAEAPALANPAAVVNPATAG